MRVDGLDALVLDIDEQPDEPSDFDRAMGGGDKVVEGVRGGAGIGKVDDASNITRERSESASASSA